MFTLRQMRLFVAVNFSDATRKKIASLAGELQKLPSDVKWVKEANFHLTVQFLGNVEEERVPGIVNALQKAVIGINSFTLALGGTGVFPSVERPRILWLGISGEVAVLSRLQRQVQEGFRQIGFPPEKRRFSPHLTLARIRSPYGFSELLKQAQILVEKNKFSSVHINSIELMLSDLKPNGPVYSVLSRIPLTGPGRR